MPILVVDSSSGSSATSGNAPKYSYALITATTYTVPATGKFIKADTTSNPITITLLTAIGRSGKSMIIKNVGNNIVTILTYSSETIDEEDSMILTDKEDSITLMSDGANWHIV